MDQLALIAKTQSLIAAGDIVGAERALVELADTEGDRALLVVLEQLPAKDILAIIREYDNSKESVVNLLVTPAMFARAVVIELYCLSRRSRPTRVFECHWRLRGRRRSTSRLFF
jgi:hypothetical protein